MADCEGNSEPCAYPPYVFVGVETADCAGAYPPYAEEAFRRAEKATPHSATSRRERMMEGKGNSEPGAVPPYTSAPCVGWNSAKRAFDHKPTGRMVEGEGNSEPATPCSTLHLQKLFLATQPARQVRFHHIVDRVVDQIVRHITRLFHQPLVGLQIGKPEHRLARLARS